MKKILSLVLIICCMLTVCSCSFINDKLGKGDAGATAGIGAFETAIENTNASGVEVKSEVETTRGKLTSEYSVSYKNDGSATIEYKYEKFNRIGEGEGEKSVIEGTVVRAADGTYSGDVPEGLDLSSVTASAALNLDPVKDAAEINESGDVLKVAVSAANSSEVFGSAFSRDVALEIFIANGVVSQMKITFEGGIITYQYS